MSVEYHNIRTVMLEYLRSHPNGQLNLIGDKSLFRLFEERGFTLDNGDLEILQQVVHEFYIEKIIFLGHSPRSTGSGAWSWPFYRLTQHGQKVVNNTEYQPYDPSGYLSRIKAEIPPIDDVITMYLEECLNCFRSNYLFSAAVMMGCAAEKAMLILVEVFGKAISDPAEQKKYEKETNFWMISRKYQALWKRLEPMASGLPNQLGDDLHTILDRVFDLIRTTRNEAGHPKGKKIELETMHANLLLFPSYCKRVYGLIKHFSLGKK